MEVSMAMRIPKIDGLCHGKSHLNGWWLGVPPFQETSIWKSHVFDVFLGWNLEFEKGLLADSSEKFANSGRKLEWTKENCEFTIPITWGFHQESGSIVRNLINHLTRLGKNVCFVPNTNSLEEIPRGIKSWCTTWLFDSFCLLWNMYMTTMWCILL